jgi:hypothetical protein
MCEVLLSFVKIATAAAAALVGWFVCYVVCCD